MQGSTTCAGLFRAAGFQARPVRLSHTSRRVEGPAGFVTWEPDPRVEQAARSVVDRGELAAGAVDLAAAGVAHGRGDALGLEAADELALVGRVAGGPLRARAWG